MHREKTHIEQWHDGYMYGDTSTEYSRAAKLTRELDNGTLIKNPSSGPSRTMTSDESLAMLGGIVVVICGFVSASQFGWTLKAFAGGVLAACLTLGAFEMVAKRFPFIGGIIFAAAMGCLFHAGIVWLGRRGDPWSAENLVEGAVYGLGVFVALWALASAITWSTKLLGIVFGPLIRLLLKFVKWSVIAAGVIFAFAVLVAVVLESSG
jgi:hypothetical protein